MLKAILSIVLFFFCLPIVRSQVIDIKFSGRLIDEVDGEAVVGATIYLSNRTDQYTAVSDTSGGFTFENIAVGRYSLKVSSLGYQSKTIGELEITSGIPKYEVIGMQPAMIEMDEVVVKAESRTRANDALTSIHTLTIEETFRFPGTYYDPARLAANYAGVINPNDQANNLVIRGNSPNLLGWYLEGVEIVNPNHLSNAGTFNDRSSQSGGGVNILSAQVLDNTTFLTGAFPAFYGNALSGILDMRLREGSRDRLHATGQIGLLGMDASIEGPLGAQKKGSYLINYRYSTLGLLSTLGVELGDEDITFHDFSFHLTHPIGKSRISFFGVAGRSKNSFAAKESSEWEEFKDQQDIDFSSDVGVLGINLRSPLWEAALLYSGYLHDRSSAIPSGFPDYEHDRSIEGRLSLHLKKRFPTGSGFIDLGLRTNHIYYDFSTANNFLSEYGGQEANTWLLQFYADSKWILSKQTTAQLGLQLSAFTLSKSNAIEPRLAIRQKLSSRQQLSLAYGLHSRTPSPQSLLYAPTGEDNTDLALIKTHHLVLSHEFSMSPVAKFTTEIFYQYLWDIPGAPGDDRNFLTINSLDPIGLQNLESLGKSQNYGLELSYHQYLTDASYFELNGTYFNSTYQGADEVRRNTRYNALGGISLTGGKEFKWITESKNRILGINLRLAYYGGFWESPIDPGASQVSLRTVYNEQEAFTEQLPGSFRMDLRVYMKLIKPKFTSIIGLDLLNATNQQNLAYHFWDPLNEKIMEKYQLGIIPNISYRIEL